MTNLSQRARGALLSIALFASCASRSAADAGGGVDAAALGTNTAPIADTGTPETPAAVGAGDPDAAVVQRICEESCATLASIPCPDRQPTCAQTCEQSQMSGPCMTERLAFLSCVIATGPSVGTCDPLEGHIDLKPGACTQEMSNLQTCIQKNAAAP